MKNFAKLKMLLSLTPVFLSVIFCHSQSFQGSILYYQDFELPKSFLDMGITKEVMLKKMNSDGQWFDSVKISYKQGNYYSIGNNVKKTLKIYKADVNKSYNFDGDICAVQDAIDLDLDGSPDKPQVIEDIEGTLTVMGLPCKGIRMKWKLGSVEYYYHPQQAAVDPALFAKHSSDGFAEFVKRSKCLPMKIVKNAMGMLISQTAVQVKPEEVSASLFKIPELVEDKDLNFLKIPGTVVMRVKR
jgi:hypothetical protein